MVAVYIDGSGLTHLLDPVSSEVLLFVAGTARTPDEILRLVQHRLQNPDVSAADLESKILRELELLEMIEAVP